jgi:hypothetical protein
VAAIVGMFAAVAGFLGVIVGAVVTGFVTLRQAQLATQREHDLRRIEWGQARKDVRDTFQRESVIVLQDATRIPEQPSFEPTTASTLSGRPSGWLDAGLESRCPRTGSRPTRG